MQQNRNLYLVEITEENGGSVRARTADLHDVNVAL